MSGPTVRAREILAPRARPAHSVAAEVGTTSVAVGLGGLVGSQSGQPVIGMAVTVALKWLGGVARDRLAEDSVGWRRWGWKLLSILG